ncbi:MAG: hypothetical protein EPO02_13275 [Nitrospirae bacterium]|nr:MAG: hypothetical protein EPO02_13275 [Nitrospirota bacterium]
MSDTVQGGTGHRPQCDQRTHAVAEAMVHARYGEHAAVSDVDLMDAAVLIAALETLGVAPRLMKVDRGQLEAQRTQVYKEAMAEAQHQHETDSEE